MILRPYQNEICEEVRLWWAMGSPVVCVQLSTGGGKTAVLSDLINGHGGFVCAIAHRDRLVEQISLTLAAGGIRHDLICSDKSKRLIAKKHVRKLGQCFYVPGARCRVASIDTLVRAKGIDKWAAASSISTIRTVMA
jgi:superfamily II DNA or RNA helicase